MFKRFLFSFPVFIALFVVVFAGYAQATGVGEHLPDLKALDQDGIEQTYETVKGEQGAVLVFIRSADWCPFCKAQLLDLAEKGSVVTELGYNIVVVSYDDPSILLAFTNKYDFPYKMLSDKGSKIIKSFGILNEDIAKDGPYYGIPNPTIYVVSADGFVQDVLAKEGYKDRPQVNAIVDSIKGNQF